MLRVTVEPQGKTYTKLLDFAMQHCSSFSLTWRDQFEIHESAALMLSSLRPFLLREVHTKEWPGTYLSAPGAMVRYYQFTEETLRILSEVPSLYAWLYPDLPEDLALYRADGTCWLFSIAHETDAGILDEEITVDDLSKAVPGLELRRERPN